MRDSNKNAQLDFCSRIIIADEYIQEEEEPPQNAHIADDHADLHPLRSVAHSCAKVTWCFAVSRWWYENGRLEMRMYA